MLYKLFAVISGLLGFYAFIPYMRDIINDRVRPARSTRVMFVLLLFLGLLQQHKLGSRLALAITLGELAGSLVILFLALKKGLGGFRRLDIICYSLLMVDLLFWLSTKNTIIAIHLTLLADLIAFTPTLEKTWRNPKSETATFFVIGAIAPIFSILATQNKTYAVILFPLYLVIFNGIEVFLIRRQEFGLINKK